MTTETLTVTPTTFEINQIINDEEFRDSHGGVWISGRNGNRWMLSLVFNNLTGAKRRDLWAHIMELGGKRNRLRVTMATLGYTREGEGGGTPLLTSQHTSGATTLAVDGGTASQTDWLVGGDWLTIGNELKIVTGDVDTIAGGVGTVKVWPEVHGTHANNDPVDVVTPHGDFFLLEAQGMGGVPHPGDWRNPAVTLILETDVVA